MNWYIQQKYANNCFSQNQCRIAKTYLEEEQIIQTAGFFDGINIPAILFAVSLILGGEDVDAATKKTEQVHNTKIDRNVVEKAVKNPNIIDLVKKQKQIPQKSNIVQNPKKQNVGIEEKIKVPKMSTDEEMKMAEMLWGESSVYWSNEKAIAAVAWTVINRINKGQYHSYSDALTTDQYHGIGNPQWDKLQEYQKNSFSGRPYEKKAWDKVLETTKKINSGEIADPTGGATFYDHLKQIPPDKIKDPKKKLAAQTFLSNYGKKYFGVKGGPYKYLTMPDGKYMYFWK